MALYGDWKKAGAILKNMSINLLPVAIARLNENGELMLKTLIGHIDNQDLPWQPLAESTIRLKNGDDTIYVETEWLKSNLSVRKIKSSVKGSTVFVGASPWKVHQPSGLKFSDLMIMLEYGTSTQPARPLLRPTWEELEPVIRKEWGKEFYSSFMQK